MLATAGGPFAVYLSGHWRSATSATNTSPVGPLSSHLFNHCLSTRGPPSMTPTDRQRSDGEIWVAHQQLSTKEHGDADSGPLSAGLDGTSEVRQTNLRWSTSDCRCRTAGAADSGSLSGRHRLAIWV